MFKRALSVILALVMCVGVLTAFPVTVSARNIEIAETGALKTPSFSGYNVTSAGIKLTWKAVKGAAKYRIFINSGNSWKKLVDTTALSYTYKARTGRSYLFTIRCVSANGKKFTSSFNRNGWRIYCLAAPKITRLSSAPTGVNMTIGKVTGAARYRVFVKSGSSWKALGDTTTTTFTHKGAKAGVKYTYTARCLSSNGKYFISDFNRTGWGVTFNPTWNQEFSRFVYNRQYMSANTGLAGESNPDYNLALQNNIRFCLFDIDKNGVPELIASSGYRNMSGYKHYVYTIKSGRLTCVGKFSSEYIFYSSRKIGFFTEIVYDMTENNTYIFYNYCSLVNGSLKEVNVVEYNILDRDKDFTWVHDDKLYSEYESCTYREEIEDPTRTPYYKITEYNSANIGSTGWDSFLRRFGF